MPGSRYIFYIYPQIFNPNMEELFLYILYSSSRDKYYVGHTQDVQIRLLQHNAGRTPSTKSGRPWIVVYTERYGDRSAASVREAEIKRMKSRTYIESLIRN